MFLTRFDINAQRRDARKLLGSPQAMHAAVLAGFPPTTSADGAGRILWRLDSIGPANTLYVLSPERPDLTHLVEQAGWPTTKSGWQTKDYQPLLDSLATGQRWGFRLTANPTKSVKLRAEDERSQRYGHVTAAQQQAWFSDRLVRLGISIAKNEAGYDELSLRDREQKAFKREGKTVTLTTAVFEGVLVVEDAAALTTALVGGIGPAKAYGCGLMTLARL